MSVEWTLALFQCETARESQARIDVARAHADFADALNDLSRETSDNYIRSTRALQESVAKHGVTALRSAVADIVRRAPGAADEADLPAGRVGLELLRDTAGRFATAFGRYPSVFARYCVDPPKPTNDETEERFARFDREFRGQIDTAIREIVTTGIDPRNTVILVGAAIDLSFRSLFRNERLSRIDAVARSMGPQSASVNIIGAHIANDPSVDLSSIPALLEKPPVGSTWLVIAHEGQTVYLPLLCRLFEHWDARPSADA